ncbi:hypothetical protein BKA69DRAFT_1043039 [Paraphysoderma sedebokerense]|nr:hypothetical protein BKA69DRAFT_1043039 [Paraphysoderma sedebokerense]
MSSESIPRELTEQEIKDRQDLFSFKSSNPSISKRPVTNSNNSLSKLTSTSTSSLNKSRPQLNNHIPTNTTHASTYTVPSSPPPDYFDPLELTKDLHITRLEGTVTENDTANPAFQILLSMLFPDVDTDMMNSMLESFSNSLPETIDYCLKYPDTFPIDSTAYNAYLASVGQKNEGLDAREVIEGTVVSLICKRDEYKDVPRDVVRGVVNAMEGKLDKVDEYLMRLMKDGVFKEKSAETNADNVEDFC